MTEKKRSLRSTGTKVWVPAALYYFLMLRSKIHQPHFKTEWTLHLNLTSQSSISSSVIHSELTWGLHKKICESTAAQCLELRYGLFSCSVPYPLCYVNTDYTLTCRKYTGYIFSRGRQLLTCPIGFTISKLLLNENGLGRSMGWNRHADNRLTQNDWEWALVKKGCGRDLLLTQDLFFFKKLLGFWLKFSLYLQWPHDNSDQWDKNTRISGGTLLSLI